MAIRNRSELYDSIKAVIGDRTDDASIGLLEDFTDTMNDYDSRTAEDWKTKYEQNDAEWRRRYTDRFNGTSPNEDFSTPGQMTTVTLEDQKVTGADTTWDDIFE